MNWCLSVVVPFCVQRNAGVRLLLFGPHLTLARRNSKKPCDVHSMCLCLCSCACMFVFMLQMWRLTIDANAFEIQYKTIESHTVDDNSANTHTHRQQRRSPKNKCTTNRMKCYQWNIFDSLQIYKIISHWSTTKTSNGASINQTHTHNTFFSCCQPKWETTAVGWFFKHVVHSRCSVKNKIVIYISKQLAVSFSKHRWFCVCVCACAWFCNANECFILT